MHTINNMIIAIDFDGTCVTHEYPKIGKDIGAIPVLKKLLKNGNNIILYTMRSGKELIDAVDWFNKNEISLYGVNTNPSQSSWTLSPKVYANNPLSGKVNFFFLLSFTSIALSIIFSNSQLKSSFTLN